ncbi:acyclic terpene utilization AtuA family protein [Porphyromonadaceae bacterium W3.11]|nr:acyclic terpene utilization AtuA family protein [Porphyromonadaceae bacterium W3.11]
MEEIRVLSPTAILGYGFPMESFQEGMKRKPHVIAVDAGSSDPGPYYLGAGISFTDRNSVKRDLEIMIPAAIEAGIPVIIGTSGGSGGTPHVAINREIIREIAEAKGLSFKYAEISSEFDKELVRKYFKDGKITPLAPAEELQEKDIDESVRIVAQMGEEPFMEALKGGAQVILAGRAYDPTVFSALAISKGYPKGLAIHMGKILECAAICALPGSGSDCMFGYLRKDHFELETLSPDRICTTLSIAAHTLYEKSNPYLLPGPGGRLNLHNTTFEQIAENRVRVAGTVFEPTDGYFVKLEGVRKVGYRTISCAAATDPIFISKIDEIVAAVKARVNNNFKDYGFSDYFLDFKVYGKGGAMGLFPKVEFETGSELLIIIEAVGATQQEADTICSFARSTMLHFGYEGRVSTAGNLALPFSPSDAHMGEVFEFNIYHLMEVEDPVSLFPITYKEFKNGKVN